MFPSLQSLELPRGCLRWAVSGLSEQRGALRDSSQAEQLRLKGLVFLALLLLEGGEPPAQCRERLGQSGPTPVPPLTHLSSLTTGAAKGAGAQDRCPGSLLISSPLGMPGQPSGPWSSSLSLLPTLPSLQVANPWAQVSPREMGRG